MKYTFSVMKNQTEKYRDFQYIPEYIPDQNQTGIQASQEINPIGGKQGDLAI